MPHKTVTWVLQANAIDPTDMEQILNCLQGLPVRIETIRVVPFSHEAADPLPQVEGPCIVYGSSGLLSLARKQGWTPAGWDGDDFAASHVLEHFRNQSLNFGAVRARWSQALQVAREHGWATVFTRPDAETKEFAGAVHTIATLEEFSANLEASGYLADRDEPMILAPVRDIIREWRAFIVDGRVISMSQYAEDGEPHQAAGAPGWVRGFVEERVSTFNPAPCFVLDVAEVTEGIGRALKVVEANSINSSGFYAADKRSILSALTDYVSRQAA